MTHSAPRVSPSPQPEKKWVTSTEHGMRHIVDHYWRKNKINGRVHHRLEPLQSTLCGCSAPDKEQWVRADDSLWPCGACVDVVELCAYKVTPWED